MTRDQHADRDWFADRPMVEKAIAAALADAVNAHGPITVENRSSAAKRIYLTLKVVRRGF